MEGSQEVTEQIIYNSVMSKVPDFWIDEFCTSQSHGFRERIIYIQKLWSHSWDLTIPTISLPSTIPVWPISFISTPEIASAMCWITQRKWCIAVSGIWQYRKPHWSKSLFTAQHDYTSILSQWGYVCFPVLNAGLLPSQRPAKKPSGVRAMRISLMLPWKEHKQRLPWTAHPQRWMQLQQFSHFQISAASAFG